MAAVAPSMASSQPFNMSSSQGIFQEGEHRKVLQALFAFFQYSLLVHGLPLRGHTEDTGIFPRHSQRLITAN